MTKTAEDYAKEMDAYAREWRCFVAEEGLQNCRKRFKQLRNRLLALGVPKSRVASKYPDGTEIL